MNSLKKLNGMKYAALAVLAVALGSGLAGAQEIAGKFNLPFTAHWGEVVLAPGQYSFINVRTSGGVPIIQLTRGTRGLGLIMTESLGSEGRSSASSYLTATGTASGYVITSLVLEGQGITVRFAVPKGEVLEASQTTRPNRKVPVLRASN
ncbi:MAG: hypothetical protein KGM47_01680 [Acidobacteriota bacterium]|nr:hypothetical protein [Acidobacteriota bacterium]